MKVFVATVLIQTLSDISAYSELVSESFDKETFESWCQEEVEAIVLDSLEESMSDSTINIVDWKPDSYSYEYSSRSAHITIDICEKEL